MKQSVQEALDHMCLRNQEIEEAQQHMPDESEDNVALQCIEMGEDRYLAENYAKQTHRRSECKSSLFFNFNSSHYNTCLII